MEKMSDEELLTELSNPFQWLITLTAGDLHELSGLNLADFSCQSLDVVLTLSSGLRSASYQTKEPQTVILSAAPGKLGRRGTRVHPRMKVLSAQIFPWRTLDHVGKLLFFFIRLCLLKNHPIFVDPVAL